MKPPHTFALILAAASLAPASSQLCRDVREQMVEPLREVVTQLKTWPDCLRILQSLDRLPSGGQLVRELGRLGVENTRSQCITVTNSIRYECEEDGLCLPQAYLYCGQWEYSATNQPKYELAMELATQADVAFDKAQQYCGLAISGNDAQAIAAGRDLLDYLENRVKPQEERFYELSCGA